MSRRFRTGGGTPGRLRRIALTGNDVAGSISGTISRASGAPDSIDVEGVTVLADPVDEGTLEAYQTELATAVTDSAGAYTIHYLVPGTYDVDLPDSLYTTTPDSVEVTVDDAEGVTDINLEITSLVSGG